MLLGANWGFRVLLLSGGLRRFSVLWAAFGGNSDLSVLGRFWVVRGASEFEGNSQEQFSESRGSGFG